MARGEVMGIETGVEEARKREWSKKAGLNPGFHFPVLPRCELTSQLFFAHFEFPIPPLYFNIVLLTHICTAKRADVSSLCAEACKKLYEHSTKSELMPSVPQQGLIAQDQLHANSFYAAWNRGKWVYLPTMYFVELSVSGLIWKKH